MATAKKKKRVFVISPTGIAVWPWVNSPDTKYDEDGIYRIKVACDPADPKAIALVKAIDEGVKKALADQKAEDASSGTKRKGGYKVMEDLPYSMETDDDDEETGRILFSFKMKAKGKTREGEEYTQKPVLYTADGTPLVGKMVGGGSKVQVSFELRTFYMATKTGGAGVSLALAAVRVLELVEYTGRNATGFGFDTSDADEYDMASQDAEQDTGSDSDHDDDSDDDDDEF